MLEWQVQMDLDLFDLCLRFEISQLDAILMKEQVEQNFEMQGSIVRIIPELTAFSLFFLQRFLVFSKTYILI